MDPTFNEINTKLDALTVQVAYLAEQAADAARSRKDQSELLRDVMPIATTVVERASAHLQEVEDFVDLPDLIRLVKKFARQAPRFEWLLDQMNGAADMLDAAGPLSKDVFNRAVVALDHLETKGYFGFARGGARIMDNIVTSFTSEEVDKLGDNIVLILRTIKDMTQPEIMGFVRNTVEAVEKDAEAPVDIGYGALIGQLRDPKTRRGLAIAMKVLGNIGAAPAETK